MQHRAQIFLLGCLSLRTALSDLQATHFCPTGWHANDVYRPISFPSAGSVSVDVVFDWGATPTPSTGGLPATHSHRSCSSDVVTTSGGPYPSTTASDFSVTTASSEPYQGPSSVSLPSTSTLTTTLTSTAVVTPAAATDIGNSANSTAWNFTAPASASPGNCTPFSAGWTTAGTGGNSSGCLQGWSSGNTSNISTTVSGSPSVAYGTSNGSYYSPSSPTMTMPSQADVRLSASSFALGILLLAYAHVFT
jgi:hypothetical protein